jgi:hypothetical protein
VDFHLERGLRLHTEPEYSSLYSWAINEIDAQGQQVGQDQIPWCWTLPFTATSCELSDGIEIKPPFQIDEIRPVPPREIAQLQVIRVKLRPGWPQDDGNYLRETIFSMFGTDRAINSFHLDIEPITDPGEQESCRAWGSVSYTSEIEFRKEKTEDCIYFYLFVKPETFARYAAKISHGSFEQMVFSVKSVTGFYSEWSPFSSTHKVKVLTRGDEHKITLPPELQFEPPRLGHVGAAVLYINRRIEFGKGPHSTQHMQTICTDAVRYMVNWALGEDDCQKPIGYSFYRRQLEEMAKAALDYAITKNIDPNKFESSVLNSGLEVVQSLRRALVKEDDKTLNFWDEYSRPLDRIKANNVPRIDRSSLGEVVDDYLALPYRSRAMDRLLVKALVAVEFYEFGDQMINEKSFSLPPNSPLKQTHTLLGYIAGC